MNAWTHSDGEENMSFTFTFDACPNSSMMVWGMAKKSDKMTTINLSVIALDKRQPEN